MKYTLKNKRIFLIIAVVAIVLILIFINRGHWINGINYRGGFTNMGYINWPQVFISLFIGILIGLFISKRKW